MDLSTGSKDNLCITLIWRPGEETFLHLYKAMWNQPIRRNRRSGSKLGKQGEGGANGQAAARVILHHLIYQGFGLGWVGFFYEYCMNKRPLWSVFESDTFTFTRYKTSFQCWHSNHSGPRLKIWFTFSANWSLKKRPAIHVYIVNIPNGWLWPLGSWLPKLQRTLRKPLSILDLSPRNSFLHNFMKIDETIKVNKATYDWKYCPSGIRPVYGSPMHSVLYALASFFWCVHEWRGVYTICLKAMTKGELTECHKVNLLSDNQKITIPWKWQYRLYWRKQN